MFDVILEQVAPYGHISMPDGYRVPPQHGKLCRLLRAPEPDIESLLADAQFPERHIAKPRRQHRVDIEHPVWCIRLQAKDRLQQREDRSRSPGLRYIGARILNRKIRRVPVQARIKLR